MSKNTLWMNSVLINLLRFTLYLEYCPSWYIFCEHLQQMCVTQILGEVFYKCHHLLVDDVVSSYRSLLIFCQVSLSLVARLVLKSPTVTVNSSITPSHSINYCFICFADLLFSAYALKIAKFLWWIDPFCHYIIFFSVSNFFFCSEIYLILV